MHKKILKGIMILSLMIISFAVHQELTNPEGKTAMLFAEGALITTVLPDLTRKLLFKKLQDEGRILKTSPIEDFTDEQLLTLELNPSSSGNPDYLTKADFEDMMKKMLKQELNAFSDKTDRKYLKLPGIDLTEEETARANGDEHKLLNLKMKKFLKLVLTGNTAGIPKHLALNEGTNAEGLFLVPTEFEMAVTKLLDEYGTFRRNCTIGGMGSKTLTKPKLLTGVTAYFTEELAEMTESEPTYGQTTWTRHDLDALTAMSMQFLEDEDVNIMNELSVLFAWALAQKEDDQGFNGTGAPITGVFNASGVVSKAIETNDPNDITIELMNTLPSLIRSVGVNGAKLFMNRVILEILLKKKDANGNFYYPGKDVWTSKTIAGFPFELNEVLPNADPGLSKAFMFFGNLKLGSTLRQRKGYSIRMSEHAEFRKKMILVTAGESFDIQHEITDIYLKITTAGA